VATAERERAALTVLHVLDPLLVQAARIEFETGLLEDSATRDLRALVVVGAPVPEILAEAEETDADLLVMGRDSFKRIEGADVSYESTAARVRAESGRPVLLLSPDDTTSGERSIADMFPHAEPNDALPDRA
jgi:nucleotide-binding universal stress UspA family protein